MTEMFDRLLLKKVISNETKNLAMNTLDDGQISCTEEKSAIRNHKHCNNQSIWPFHYYSKFDYR